MLPPEEMLTTKNLSAEVPAILVALLLLVTGCQPPGTQALIEGDRLLRAAQPAEAVTQLKLAAELMPGNSRTWNYLGLAAHQAGQASLAAEAYRKAITVDRNNPVVLAYYNLGCLYLELGQPRAAADALNSYVLLTNSLPGVLKLGTALLQDRRPEDAEQAFSKALRQNPRNAEAWNGVGLAQAQRNRLREAARSFDQALLFEPGYPPAMLNVAIVLHHQAANRTVALQRYRDYLALQPPPPYVASVQRAVQLLEAELAPPVRLTPTNQLASRSNLVNAVSNALAAVRSNLPTARVVVSNPPPVTVITQRVVLPLTNPPQLVISEAPTAPALTETNPLPSLPVVTNPVPTIAVVTQAPAILEIPITVVAVPEPDPVRVGTEITIPAATDRPVPATASPVTAALPPTTVVRPAPEAGTNAEPRKRGFLARINPVNWFGSGTKPAPVTPVPTADAPVFISANPTNPGARVSPTLTTPPPRPVFKRYAYRQPAAPAAGNRNRAEAALDAGQKAADAKQWADAARQFRAAAAADPGWFDAQFKYALACYQTKQLPEALAVSEIALALNPGDLPARYNFGLMLRDASYPVDSAAEFERVLQARPDDSRALLALGNLNVDPLENPQQAREYYSRLLTIEPNHPQAGRIRLWLQQNP